jgi:OOP family OmpA-OmpF porin
MQRITKAVCALGLVGGAAIASPNALADDTGWYIGGNIGQSKAKIDDARITSGLLGGGFATSSISDSNSDTGYKIFGGYKFNQNFALEGGYFNLGKFGFVANTLPAGTLNGNIKLDGWNLDAVGILPISERFSAFGRVGINYARASDTFSGSGFVNVPNPGPSNSEINPKVGLGLQYDLTATVSARIEAERYRVNDAVGNHGDIDLLSLGLVYHFGTAKPAPMPDKTSKRDADTTAPAKMMEMPAPVLAAPVPVTPPPMQKAPPQKFTFSEEDLFKFGEADLLPHGKEKLDEMANDLAGAQYETIHVTGYTDRIGSPEYNMRLSLRRADVVKEYLVSKGIPAERIEAEGRGETQPTMGSAECRGKTSAQDVACLQPDRRTEVEVIGMRASQ